MRFINNGEAVQVRVGNWPGEMPWVLLQTGETIELPERIGKAYGLSEVKVTEGKIGSTKVETKQFEPVKKKDNFRKEIKNIKGIGKKIAEDIIQVFPTEEELIKAIKSYEHLPFRDDVAEKLIKKYGK